jgi:predicted transcriptional regulator
MAEMTIESLQQKIDNQNKLIKELTIENEELYHQYNHLIIRNGKMLKRVDDFQKIIDDLHIRIEELQLINGNMMQLNDKLRRRNTTAVSLTDMESRLHDADSSVSIESEFNVEELSDRWKQFPGQTAQNGPNVRKQVLMLVYLYTSKSLNASELFTSSGVGGVTGARYVSHLKKFEMIRYTGARKKGRYEITRKGMDFIEGVKSARTNTLSDMPRENNFTKASKETLKDERVHFNSIPSDHNDL